MKHFLSLLLFALVISTRAVQTPPQYTIDRVMVILYACDLVSKQIVRQSSGRTDLLPTNDLAFHPYTGRQQQIADVDHFLKRTGGHEPSKPSTNEFGSSHSRPSGPIEYDPIPAWQPIFAGCLSFGMRAS